MSTYRKEVFRKTIHMLSVVLAIMWLYALEDWKMSVAYAGASVLVFYPLLRLMAKIPGLSSFMNARKSGDYANSYLMLVTTYVAVAIACWGLYGERFLVATSFLAWGPGDAAAALVGKKYGKHRIGREKRKTLEGSLAMFTFCFLSVFAVLMIYNRYSIPMTVLVSLITAVVTTIVEFLAPGGCDTFLCPISAMIILLIFENLL